MCCQLLHFNYGTWKFKPWVWAIAPFFPAYLPWYQARAEAALPREPRPPVTILSGFGLAFVGKGLGS